MVVAAALLASVATAQTPQESPKGPIAIYEFKEAAPLANSVAGSRIGALTLYGAVELQPGKAILTGQKDNQLMLPGLERILSGKTSWTFAIEGKIAALSSDNHIASYADGSELDRRLFEIRHSKNGGLYVAVPSANGKSFAGIGATLTEADRRFRVAISYDATAPRAILMANGKCAVRTDIALPAAISEKDPLRLGIFRSGWGPMNGEIVRVSIFDRALSEKELVALFSDETATPQPSAPVAR
jgi:hypothetical protein